MRVDPFHAMSVAFCSMSAACLLHPVPETALASFLYVLRDIPSCLARPFVVHELNRVGISVQARDVSNVLFKLRAAGLCNDVDKEAGPTLKLLQASCPDSPTVHICEGRSHCIECRVPLSEDKPHESFNQQFPKGMQYEPTVAPTRFRAFTQHAGCQFATFQPKWCPSCRKNYIAGWAFKCDRNRIIE